MYIHLLSISVLGISLLWSLRLVYGRRFDVPNDALVLVITQASWILVYLGIGLVFGPIVLVVAFFIAAMVVAQYRDSERRALLWTLSIAADYDLSLSDAARSFASGRVDEIGRRAIRLADCLDQGMALPNAMRASRNLMPRDAELAAQLGYATGSLGVTLRDAAKQSNRLAATMHGNFSAMLYFATAIGLMVAIMTFVCMRIAPTYEQILLDFQIPLPKITVFFLSATNVVARYAFIFVPALIVPLAIFVYALVGYVGFRVPHLPVLGGFHGDSAVILRTLGSSVAQGRSVLESIDLLSQWYPENQIGARLALVAKEIRGGAHWCDTLLKRKFIRTSDAALLKSAERVGNLEWACRELSDAMSRRMAFRIATFSRFLGPVLALLVGVPVALFAVAMLAPIAVVVRNLAL